MNHTFILSATAIGFAFLLGAFPTAYLLGRLLKGIDIRTVGSGNVGATNVFRTLGKGPGIVTLIIDMAKGAIPVFLAQHFSTPDYLPLSVGLAAIFGHTCSPFLRFRGGKGVATSGGVFATLLPLPTGIALLTFGLFFFLSRRVAIGSIMAAITLPTTTFFLAGAQPITYITFIVGGWVIYCHRSNIRQIFMKEKTS